MQLVGKNIWERLQKRFRHKDQSEAVVISRDNHQVSRKSISSAALKVLYRLNEAGHDAYLVGGSVRDLLLNRQPKDFDVATSAYPEEIRKIFRNSRIIGRRFRLVHVYFHEEVIEVSTFRANSTEMTRQSDSTDLPIMVSSDNTYGTIEEDAWRRDFTVNALYYSVKNFSVMDYTGGMLDLDQHLIRMIGDPVQRYHEDPVRLLRAIRLSAKLGFRVETQTEAPLLTLSHLLGHVAAARLFDEILKLFFEGNALVTYKSLVHYGYMRVLFPVTFEAIKQRQQPMDSQLIKLAMSTTDERFANAQSLNPGFLLSVILWPALQLSLSEKQKEKRYFYQIIQVAMDELLEKQMQTITIPKRLTAMMQAVWLLQYHLMKRRGKRVYRMIAHRYFRAAYDFLELRVKAGEPYQEVLDWWRDFQAADHDGREALLKSLKND